MWRAGSHEQDELIPCAENFSLEVDGEDGAPNSNFSKLSELSETSGARKLIFGLQVNIDNKHSLQSQIWRYPEDGPGPAKTRNPHISVLYIHVLCEVKFKFEYFQLNKLTSYLMGLFPVQLISLDKRKLVNR